MLNYIYRKCGTGNKRKQKTTPQTKICRDPRKKLLLIYGKGPSLKALDFLTKSVLKCSAEKEGELHK